MNFTFGQIPNQPGVHSPKEKLSSFGPLFCPGHMFQNPLNLCGRKISVRNQTCAFPHRASISFLNHLVYFVCRSSALPDNRRIHRFSCLLIPDYGCLSLICNSNRRNIRGICSDFTHCLYRHTHLTGPDLHGIMLHPSGFWIILGKFSLRHAADPALPVKQNTA